MSKTVTEKIIELRRLHRSKRSALAKEQIRLSRLRESVRDLESEIRDIKEEIRFLEQQPHVPATVKAALQEIEEDCI
jgi:predicted  nucleic acid-binding Zn-ribbon protein